MTEANDTLANSPLLKLGLPKGRMQEGVFALLGDAGVQIRQGKRSYRPTLSLEHIEAKILKPQNIVEMLHVGSRDLGFAGADWVAELGAELTEVLDLGLNPVRLVAAAPEDLLIDGKLPDQPLVIASEYTRLTKQWIKEQNLDAKFVRAYGATEVFPPEDADCIVDNTATGSTLTANQLEIVDTLMHSSTRLYAHPAALDDPAKRSAIEDLKLVLESVLEARKRVMLELNVPREKLDEIVKILPCMREPTISSLHSSEGWAVKAAVPRKALATLIPELKAAGGADIVVTKLAQIVP
ncbi:MAG: ATP phosphoribosyltransferase [Myxococcota bacterium]|nr:ATP phosphoribosyltransferase [Myxococcota bacterium]MEC9442309.1 ATP phosphoribosyltransferase [Myxococcota bacterium]